MGFVWVLYCGAGDESLGDAAVVAAWCANMLLRCAGGIARAPLGRQHCVNFRWNVRPTSRRYAVTTTLREGWCELLAAFVRVFISVRQHGCTNNMNMRTAATLPVLWQYFAYSFHIRQHVSFDMDFFTCCGCGKEQ